MVTFIVPSLNRPTLNNAINSIINQTNPNWKCIVVYDEIDGQKFNDERIITIIANVNMKKCSCFTNSPIMIYQKCLANCNDNGRAGYVRNEGIKITDTEWIAFLDDDDSIHPEYVETLLNKYKESDCVIFKMQMPNGKILPTIPEIAKSNVGISFAYKRNLNLLFDAKTNAEDYIFLTNILKYTGKITFAEEIYYYVRK
jgi:glycosyltransferase involved in cell wall biosynthesis